MLNFALVAATLLLPGTALAHDFIVDDCDGSSFEEQDWYYSHTGGSGTETWKFTNCVGFSSSVCNGVDPDRCFNSNFTTTDGGTGTATFSLALQGATCDAVPGPGTVFPSGYHYSPGVQTCDYAQSINLTYDVTGAHYLGEAGTGELTRKRRYYCTIANVPASCTATTWGIYNQSVKIASSAWDGDIYNSSWADVGDFECDH